MILHILYYGFVSDPPTVMDLSTPTKVLGRSYRKSGEDRCLIEEIGKARCLQGCSSLKYSRILVLNCKNHDIPSSCQGHLADTFFEQKG